MVTTSPSRLTPSICPSPLCCVPMDMFTVSGRTVGSVTATPDVEILVIGAGQAGLSVGYHLRRLGLRPEQDFLIVDHSPAAGGAWQFRWPSLTLSTVNRVHDLPGMSFEETLPEGSENAQAASAVPHYFELYEKRFDLRVHRPVSVSVVCDRATAATCPDAEVDGLLHAEVRPMGLDYADRAVVNPVVESGIRARGLINATGTWDKPFIPFYRGASEFTGRQLHAHDYRTADEFMRQAGGRGRRRYHRNPTPGRDFASRRHHLGHPARTGIPQCPIRPGCRTRRRGHGGGSGSARTPTRLGGLGDGVARGRPRADCPRSRSTEPASHVRSHRTRRNPLGRRHLPAGRCHSVGHRFPKFPGPPRAAAAARAAVASP